MSENYVNELGVFKATIKRCFERGQVKQSKPACYLEFERDSDKAIVSMRFSNPMNSADLFKVSKVVQELTGKYIKVDVLKTYAQSKLIESLNKLSGTKANVYVRPHDIPGFKKTIWGVEDVINEKFTATSVVSGNEPVSGDLDFGSGSFGSEDDIPF